MPNKSRTGSKRTARRTSTKRTPTRRTPTRRTATRRPAPNSGMPGGGAGRREEVGGSGVYPASGPLPKENAPYQPMASWGQGERGAGGYYDSGRSPVENIPPSKVGQRRPPARKSRSRGKNGK